jgi:hypothetical protein
MEARMSNLKGTAQAADSEMVTVNNVTLTQKQLFTVFSDYSGFLVYYSNDKTKKFDVDHVLSDYINQFGTSEVLSIKDVTITVEQLLNILPCFSKFLIKLCKEFKKFDGEYVTGVYMGCRFHVGKCMCSDACENLGVSAVLDNPPYKDTDGKGLESVEILEGVIFYG